MSKLQQMLTADTHTVHQDCIEHDGCMAKSCATSLALNNDKNSMHVGWGNAGRVKMALKHRGCLHVAMNEA